MAGQLYRLAGDSRALFNLRQRLCRGSNTGRSILVENSWNERWFIFSGNKRCDGKLWWLHYAYRYGHYYSDEYKPGHIASRNLYRRNCLYIDYSILWIANGSIYLRRRWLPGKHICL